ncbi:hypothetical protein B0H14DRAFT_3452582 [Mycena olivaceomarginata]|nr:hypothetical protein B0H14DRAFT_3452582 [Mycena olivaceomarginata]
MASVCADDDERSAAGTHRRLRPFRSSSSSGSGHLPVASIAPTQRLRFILTSSSPGPHVAESRSPIHTPVAPCPRSAIRSETPRPSLARNAPAAAFAAVQQFRALTASNRHPADRTTHFSSPPSLLCLCLSARVSLEMLPLSPILHAAAFASTANPACLRGARERGCARAILARVGSDSTTAREWIRQQLWTSDSEFSLPPRTPLRFQSPILSSFLAPTPASIFRAHREHECDRTHSFLGADSLTRA